MKIKFKEDRSDTSVRVDNKSTASLTARADSTRSPRDREFKILDTLVTEHRKADREADTRTNLDELILGARTLSNREWRQAVKFAKTLRKADRELTKSELVEKRAKQARFKQAQEI